MRALILADGDPPSVELARYLAEGARLVLATDGAAHQADTLGIVPDIICGDFDSVGMDTAGLQIAFPRSEIVSTPDQSYADLEKAILLARKRGANEVVLIGNTGGRTDHTLASFALLARYAAELSIWQVSDYRQGERMLVLVTGTLLAGQECLLGTTPGNHLSMVTFTGTQVSIEGVAWPLSSQPLEPGTVGVSNIATGNEVRVSAERGTLFLIAHRELQGCLERWQVTNAI